MGRVGNSTSSPDQSDIRPHEPQAISQGHRGGRRSGSGMKELALDGARSTNKGHVKAFRAGSQDARDGAGHKSPHPNVKRRGNGPVTRLPSPAGGM